LISLIGKVLLWLVIPVLLLSCGKEKPAELMLLDFESDSELDKLHWSCHALYSLSDDHATHGSKSLKLELFPSDYPGLDFSPAVKDWRDHKALCLDVFNPSAQQIQLTIRIDDKKDSPDYDDRYNKSFTINPGANHIAIPLDSISASRANRHLDLAHIRRMFISESHPQDKTTFFIDAIKLQ
jgi:hypothetical protein